MSRKYKIHSQDKIYFVTYTVVNWIDLFTQREYKDIILRSLEYCTEKKGLQIFSWCIMTNHVHLIIGTQGDKIENILRDHKKHTSEILIKTILNNPIESRKKWILSQFREAGQANSNNTHYQLWQQHNKPIEIYSHDVILNYVNYIHNNPVKAGFVYHPQDWLYSSAAKTTLLNCLTPIDVAMWGD